MEVMQVFNNSGNFRAAVFTLFQPPNLHLCDSPEGGGGAPRVFCIAAIVFCKNVGG